MTKQRRLAIATACLGAASAYPFVEARAPRLTRRILPFDRPVPALRILHISDTHLYRRTRSLARWIESLPNRLPYEPDLVFGTGDFIEDNSGIDMLLSSLAPLSARLGLFYVLGSHDYYQAEAANYLKYFVAKPPRPSSRRAATSDLENGLKELGWRSLTNASEVMAVGSSTIRIAGMDDPYLDRHDPSVLRRESHDAFAVALMHAPNLVAEAVLAGFDLILSGHTHGGQVRLPFAGALVTNSQLPAALAAGPQRIGSSWLHVTPGLGTGKFTPIRFNCRPEATLLEVVPTG